jgi:hypothetical protein
MASPSEPLTPRQIRSIVTQEALHVSASVLGLPLAHPMRRATAIAVDGLLVALLTRTPSVLFGVAAAWVLFRAAAPRSPAGYLRRSFRFMMRFGAAVVLFVVAVSLWDNVRDRIRGRGGDDGGPVQASLTADAPEGAGQTLEMDGMEAARFAGDVVALHRADGPAEAREAAEELLERVHEAGLSGEQARAMVRELAGDVEEKPWLGAAVEGVLATDEAAEREEAGMPTADSARALADSAIAGYAAALAAGDTVAADSLRPGLVAMLSEDTVRALDLRYEALETERDGMQSRVRELEERAEEGPGLIALFRRFMEDLGLGLGWVGLYFTATTALWQGRTAGKRLLGIRVVRLTGRPIGWWASFERFGGYAAGFATGLLGFAQILWDDNRQAIHDKIASTVVIRDVAAAPDARARPEP